MRRKQAPQSCVPLDEAKGIIFLSLFGLKNKTSGEFDTRPTFFH